MRKQKMKQAEELLAQMELAHEQIRKDIEQKNVPSAVSLLGIVRMPPFLWER